MLREGELEGPSKKREDDEDGGTPTGKFDPKTLKNWNFFNTDMHTLLKLPMQPLCDLKIPLSLKIFVLDPD